MTETLVGVGSLKNAAKKSVGTVEQELAAARELVKAARDRGVELTGADGLLKAITNTVLETALEEEMSEHIGYAPKRCCTTPPGRWRSRFRGTGTAPSPR